MNPYTTVKEFAESYFEDRHSKFIGLCQPVSTEAEALEFISAVKKKYSDAKHWVYAYVIRENNTTRFTDDREPQGTAGMPVLDAIRKNGCTDTVIVVVRYFGGILLGTGGLVHAYSEAAISALKAAKIIRYDIYTTLSLSASYSDYQKLIPVLAEYDFRETDTDYSTDVCILGSLKAEQLDAFSNAVTQATSARALVEKISEDFDYRE